MLLCIILDELEDSKNHPESKGMLWMVASVTISILIEASKIDQTWKGFKPFISSTGDNLRLVAALVSYMVLKGQARALVPVEWSRGH